MDIDLRSPNLTSTLQITGCHFGAKPPGWRFERHHHFLFEILYCREGTVTESIGESAVRLEEGNWLLIKSGVAHESVNDSEGRYRFFNVHFDLDDPQLRYLFCLSDYALMKDDALAGELLSSVEEAIAKLQGGGEGTAAGAIRMLQIQQYVLRLIGRFAEELLAADAARKDTDAVLKAGVTVTSGETAIAREIEALLRERPGHPKGAIGQIASRMGLSRSQCTKIFSRVYGESPRQYVSRSIVSRAKRLLVMSTLSVGQIAAELGFESPSHFSRQFRRWTGVAPSHYRPRLQGDRQREAVPSGKAPER